MKNLYTILMFLVLLAPHPSHAAAPPPWAAPPTTWAAPPMWVPPSTPYRASSTTWMVPPQRNSIELKGQYYDLSVEGLAKLCEASPERCAAPGIAAELDRLKTKHNTAWGIVIGGGVVAVAGFALTLGEFGSCDPHDLGSRCMPRMAGMMALTGVGMGISFVGLTMVPGRDDLVGLLNKVNQQYPDDPVRMQVGWIAPSVPGAAIAGTF